MGMCAGRCSSRGGRAASAAVLYLRQKQPDGGHVLAAPPVLLTATMLRAVCLTMLCAGWAVFACSGWIWPVITTSDAFILRSAGLDALVGHLGGQGGVGCTGGVGCVTGCWILTKHLVSRTVGNLHRAALACLPTTATPPHPFLHPVCVWPAPSWCMPRIFLSSY
jgi:hypothetical protein